MTPQEIARHLDERFALLELPAAGRLTRHRTLEAALEASYVLLSKIERTFFDRLSVFVAPFDLDAAAAVGFVDREPPSRALDVVTGLVDASMLTREREGEQTRYRLLETLREFGGARLRERSTEDEARHAHADYHLDLAARAGAVLGTPEFTPWMDRLAQSYAELRAALEWSLQNEPRAVTMRAAPALREFWYRRGELGEAGRWAARMLEGDIEAVPPGLLAEVHIAASYSAAISAPEFPAAVSHGDEAVRLARVAGSGHGLVIALWSRALVDLALGEPDSMRPYAAEALATCEGSGDRWGRAGPLTAMGFSLLFGGSPDEARPWFEEALPLYGELGDLGNLVVTTLTPLTSTALLQKDLPAAERYATEALELASGTGWEASALVWYGEVLTALGDPDAAETATVRALRIALDVGLENWFRWALRNLARAAAERGRYEDAAVLLAASRRNIPAYGLDPTIYGPVEERCRDVLGSDGLEELAARGDAMTHDQLIDLVGAVELRTVPTAAEASP